MVNERLTVRIFLPRCQTTTVRVPLQNLVPCSEEPAVKVLWAFPTHANNGKSGFMMKDIANEATLPGESWLQQKNYKISDLLEECRPNDFVQHETDLCKVFGLHVVCFAQPFVWEQQGTGQNNRAGTFFTIRSHSGYAKDTILGPCVLVRLSPQTGEAVDFHPREAIQALNFISDVVSMYTEETKQAKMHPLTKEIIRDLVNCFPYYDIGCVMDFGGFTGPRQMQGKADGAYEKTPPDMLRICDDEVC